MGAVLSLPFDFHSRSDDGYEILDFSCDVGKTGAIDIISKNRDVIFFTEVRTKINDKIDCDSVRENKDINWINRV